MGKICIFTGHREIPAHTEPLRDALLRHITSLYADGCTDFLCGGAKGFDLLAAEALLELRPILPDARLIMILPCMDQERAYAPQTRHATVRFSPRPIWCATQPTPIIKVVCSPVTG